MNKISPKTPAGALHTQPYSIHVGGLTSLFHYHLLALQILEQVSTGCNLTLSRGDAGGFTKLESHGTRKKKTKQNQPRKRKVRIGSNLKAICRFYVHN